MTKFNVGDMVRVVGSDAAAIYGRIGRVVKVSEQEPLHSNFYTIAIGDDFGRPGEYGVFENEIEGR